MRRTFAPLALSLGLALLLAGCARNDPVEAIDGDVTPVTATPSLAGFTLDGPRILAPDGTDRDLYEDDASALVRYTVRHASDAAGPADAFVTYFLDGRIVDSNNVRLKPGEEKAFERAIATISVGETHRVEVRVGAQSGKDEATVKAWPRPGEELTLGGLTLRIDYGIQYPEAGRVQVNVTVARAADDAPAAAFRVKLVCADADGDLVLGESQPAPLADPGTTRGADIDLPDCAAGQQRYALEFKLDQGGATKVGRIVLVETSGTPP